MYISTQTKIGYLNNQIDLNDVFWKIPILPYERPEEGVIKKIMKINSIDEHAVEELWKNILKEKVTLRLILFHRLIIFSGDKKIFKDIRKITIGSCKKDLINFRKRKKSAFYNCFATIIRIFLEGSYKEINIKIFQHWQIRNSRYSKYRNIEYCSESSIEMY